MTDEMPFPISILGWHEIEAVADQAEARISLLDRIGNAAEIKQLYIQMKAGVEHARDLLPLLQRQIKKLEASLKEMWELQRKRKTLQRLEQGELLSLQQQYEWFLSTEQRLAGLESLTKERSARVPEIVTSHISLGIPDPPQSERSEQLRDTIREIEANLAENIRSEQATISTMQTALSSVVGATERAKSVLATSFAAFRDDVYTPKVNALPPEDREILTKQIQVLEETKRLPLVEQQSGSLLEEVRSLSEQIRLHCDSIYKIRESVIEILEIYGRFSQRGIAQRQVEISAVCKSKST